MSQSTKIFEGPTPQMSSRLAFGHTNVTFSLAKKELDLAQDVIQITKRTQIGHFIVRLPLQSAKFAR